jgi:DNA/RNA-binding domain of Phe-tRNA-synthetase-like protein
MNPLRVTTDCQSLGLRAAGMLLSNVHIEPAADPLRLLIDDTARNIQLEFETLSHIRKLKNLVAVQQILRQVNVKPRQHPPSSQKLMEYAWRRGTLPTVNNLVDCYNLVSLRTQLSLGAHDLDLIACPVQLRLFQGQETFHPLGQTQPRPVVVGEFGYVDAQNRVLCRLDSLQADFSKVTARTRRVLLIIETTASREDQPLYAAIEQLEELLKQHCQAKLDQLILPED